jgi:hypothetical protein
VRHQDEAVPLEKVGSLRQLEAGTWTDAPTEGRIIACFDLAKGPTTIS